jgi:serine/threonine protein kinase, bacterial
MPLSNGNQLAGFFILRLWGCVGVDEVYFAQRPRLPGGEALKMFSTGLCADDAYCRLLIREPDPAAALRRLNVVRANDRGEFNRRSRISVNVMDGTAAPPCAPLLPAIFPSRACVQGALVPQVTTPAA